MTWFFVVWAVGAAIALLFVAGAHVDDHEVPRG
jgi:hypothetical protein